MDDSYDVPRGRGGIRLLPILIGLAVIGFMAIRGCQEGPFGRHQIVGMAPQQEAALGAQAYGQVLAKAEVVRDGEVVRVVKRLAKELIDASRNPEFVKETRLEPPDFQWECNVVRSQEVNAFCMPGGKIVVYTGILPVAETESALAAVMGHEIGHALAHHGAERMAQEKMFQIAESSAAGAISDMPVERQRQVLGVLGVGGKYGVLLPFSRKHESEADRIGLLLMATAGRDPHKAIEFWQRMEKASRGGQPPAFLSTHPSHEQRIRDLETLLNEAIPFYEQAPEKIPDQPLPLGDLGRASRSGAGASGGDDFVSSRPATREGTTQGAERARGLLKYLREHRRTPEGYEGGRTYLNLGRDGEETLPHDDRNGRPIKYQEWDLHRHVPGKNRGPERLITGSDGSAYYTPDHYRTFQRIR